MFIYRGRGILIAGVTFGCLLATEFATRLRFHDDRYYQEHGWPKLVGFFIAAGVVASLSGFTLGSLSEMNPPPKTSMFRKDDELFFIPAQYWPPILCLLGIGFYFVRG